MTEEQIHKEAVKRSLIDMPHTCHQVYDCLYYIFEKYHVSQEDRDFTKAMITGRTKALRRSLVALYEKEVLREIADGLFKKKTFET